MSKTAPGQSATGKAIIEAILETMRQSLEPLYSYTLVPGVYKVFLHSTDHNHLKQIFDRVREDAIVALDKTLEKWRSKRLPLKKERFEKAQEWSIDFYRDPNSELELGEILVYSEIVSARPAEHGSGNETRRVATIRRKIQTGLPDSTTRTVRSYACIKYKDDSGPREYQVTQPEITVGRGGTDVEVQLRLIVNSDVSRRHCLIRWDANSGSFLIKDVSSNGTKINGTQVPCSIKGANGKQQDLDIWVPLSSNSTIDLAGKIQLLFESTLTKPINQT